MDFDTIVSLLFIFFFFVLPSILKQVRKKNRVKAKPVKPVNTQTLVGRIRAYIQRVSKEIEEQQKRHRQASSEKAGDVWQELADEDFEDTLDSSGAYEYVPEEPAVEAVLPADQIKTDPLPAGARRDVGRPDTIVETARFRSDLNGAVGSSKPAFSVRQYGSSPMQNALVWSEILGKPKALKSEF